MKRLEGKVLLVAGGGADGPPNKGETLAIGNGRAIAILCAREGARVMVTDRSLASAQETAAAIRAEGGEADARQTDVSGEEACQVAVNTTVARFGALHLMVNNVGIVYPVDDFSIDVPDYDKIMSVNLRGQFLMLKYSSPKSSRPAAARSCLTPRWARFGAAARPTVRARRRSIRWSAASRCATRVTESAATR